jgi:hypothetical protein
VRPDVRGAPGHPDGGQYCGPGEEPPAANAFEALPGAGQRRRQADAGQGEQGQHEADADLHPADEAEQQQRQGHAAGPVAQRPPADRRQDYGQDQHGDGGLDAEGGREVIPDGPAGHLAVEENAVTLDVVPDLTDEGHARVTEDAAVLGAPHHPRPDRALRQAVGPLDEGRRDAPVGPAVDEHGCQAEAANLAEVAPEAPVPDGGQGTAKAVAPPCRAPRPRPSFHLDDHHADDCEGHPGGLAQDGQREAGGRHAHAVPPRAIPTLPEVEQEHDQGRRDRDVGRGQRGVGEQVRFAGQEGDREPATPGTSHFPGGPPTEDEEHPPEGQYHQPGNRQQPVELLVHVKGFAAPALPGVEGEGMEVDGQWHGAEVEEPPRGSRPPAFQPEPHVGRLVEGGAEPTRGRHAPGGAGDGPGQQPDAIQQPTASARTHLTTSLNPNQRTVAQRGEGVSILRPCGQGQGSCP